MGYLLAYTRIPQKAYYHAALARSVHLAYSPDGKHYEALNQNYGILFATAEITAQDTIMAKGLTEPRLARLADGAYRIQARQTNEAGEPEPLYPLWETRDFQTFTYLGASVQPALTGEEPPVACAIPDMIPGCRLAVDDALGNALLRHWQPLTNVEVCVPEQIIARNAGDVAHVLATAVYSDGSTCEKHVAWDLAEVDFQTPGETRVMGTVEQLEPVFPIACGHGDPIVFPWQGQWVYISTNDNNGNYGFTARRAATVKGLFADGYEQSVILDVNEERVQTFWAPEFHVIGGELYILFAVSGKKWGPQCHTMKLKPGGDILCARDWEAPVRACLQNGQPLTQEGITLDMTYILAGGRSYVVWSQRMHIGTTLDSGSMLYIATIDPENPAWLTSAPVLLTRPLYGWENIDGTINNEGPNAFLANGKVYLAYSGGAADKYTYAIGMLTAEENADLLDLANWYKSPTPVLNYFTVPGRYGPGHNGFFREEGKLYITYHAEYDMDRSPRCAALHRVHFGADGEPRFDLVPERDLAPELRKVTTVVCVP
jgi:GH43 family beta-xylosidase